VKAQVLTGINEMEMAELADPQIHRPDDVLLKIEVVGVCGSDVHYYETGRIGSQIVDYPYRVGHECSATVVETGSDVKSLVPGDLVAVDPAVSCGNCYQCSIGRGNTCRDLTFLGTPGQGDGCLCEYIVMPERSCFKVSGKLNAVQAALSEPFAIGVYAVKQGLLPINEKIAILGSGPIGLSCMVAARAENIKKIYMTDIIDERVAFAKAHGADYSASAEEIDIVESIKTLEPDGIDAVYECAGEQSTLDQGIELLRPGGKLVIIGIPRQSRVSFSIDKIRRKEITIVNIRRQNETTRQALELLSSGKANIDFMATHKFPFKKSKQAFDLVARYEDGVIKAMIEF